MIRILSRPFRPDRTRGRRRLAAAAFACVFGAAGLAAAPDASAGKCKRDRPRVGFSLSIGDVGVAFDRHHRRRHGRHHRYASHDRVRFGAHVSIGDDPRGRRYGHRYDWRDRHHHRRRPAYETRSRRCELREPTVIRFESAERRPRKLKRRDRHDVHDGGGTTVIIRDRDRVVVKDAPRYERRSGRLVRRCD